MWQIAFKAVVAIKHCVVATVWSVDIVCYAQQL